MAKVGNIENNPNNSKSKVEQAGGLVAFNLRNQIKGFYNLKDIINYNLPCTD